MSRLLCSVARNSEPLPVVLERGVLWIGSAAYPLQNIARAQTIAIVPDRARAVRRFVAQVLVWATLAVGAALAVTAEQARIVQAQVPHADPDQLRHLAWAAALVLFAVSTIRLMVLLSRRTYYVMIIETAGSPRTALASYDEREVSSLVAEVMNAIHNPEVHYETRVHNITSIGEQYNVSGQHNLGKQVAR